MSTSDGGLTGEAASPTPGSKEASGGDSRSGFLVGFAAFTAWGLIPIYWKALDWVAPMELLAHRVLWSTLAVGAAITATGSWRGFFRSFASSRARLLVALSGMLIGVNWGLFIWAVNSGRILETSLAYYMNPLINVLIGFAFFGERLRRLQLLALGFAAAGVANLTFAHGAPPWLALTLAVTFSLYAAARKTAGVPALHGLFFETALLCPAALLFLLCQGAGGRIFTAGPGRGLLLAASGVITSLPLAAFAYGVRRLRLVTVGLLQFISPSISFLLGIFVYREPFSATRLVTFVLIWVGVAAYSLEGIWMARQSEFTARGKG